MYLDRVVSKRPHAPSVHITNVSTFTLMTPLSLRGVFNIYTFRSHFDSRTKSSAFEPSKLNILTTFPVSESIELERCYKYIELSRTTVLEEPRAHHPRATVLEELKCTPEPQCSERILAEVRSKEKK